MSTFFSRRRGLFAALILAIGLSGPVAPTAAASTDRVDSATSVLNIGSDGKSLLPSVAALADSDGNPTTTRFGADLQTWNAGGGVWGRPWSNVQINGYIPTGTYVSTQTGADQLNPSGRGVRCVYDVTAVSSVGSFTVEIDGKDATSGKYYSLLTATAVTTVSTNVLTVYPGITAVSSAPNFAASQVMPRAWRAKAVYNSGTNQTFSVGCDVML